MKTNEVILSQKEISYSDIKLLKNRANKVGSKDPIYYDTFDPIKIDFESGNKGLVWLRSLLNTKGKPRKGVCLGYREIDIIIHATNEDFEFIGFYDDGSYGYKNFKPIYKVGGMEYVPFANGQKIYVIG